MPSLAETQTELSRSLLDGDRPVPSALGRASNPSRRRFDVHRNNRAVGLIEALQSGFPAVRRLVGDEYFAAAARAYIDAHPPRSPVLLQYGRYFGDFLEALPAASAAPYLGDVARLEWSRLKALHAADGAPAGIERLGEVPESVINDVTLNPHPSLSIVASRWPVVSLWIDVIDPDASVEVDMKRAERAMIVRPALRVAVHRLPAGGEVFLDALANGETLGAAARRALNAEETFDLADQLRLAFRAGAFVSMNLPTHNNP